MNGEKTRYRVMLLLVVGLTAFSSAMKELNQFQQFTLDTSHLIAQLTEKIAPAQVPQTVSVPQPAAKTETCEMKQSLPSVELPWLNNDASVAAVVTRPSQIIEVRRSERRSSRPVVTLGPMIAAKLKKIPQLDFDPDSFETNVPADHDAGTDNAAASQFPSFTFKAKTRRQSSYRFNTRDREMLLKTLNRSLNLRIAS
jgi:hypothetical protein